MDVESSENASGAVNQQERLVRTKPESSETICRAPSLKSEGEDMARTAWRHAEPGRNVLAPD